jgi:hypothetical protein
MPSVLDHFPPLKSFRSRYLLLKRYPNLSSRKYLVVYYLVSFEMWSIPGSETLHIFPIPTSLPFGAIN